MDKEKFICYGTYKEGYIKCLIKCPYKIKCELITNMIKFEKEREEQNGKNE